MSVRHPLRRRPLHPWRHTPRSATRPRIAVVVCGALLASAASCDPRSESADDTTASTTVVTSPATTTLAPAPSTTTTTTVPIDYLGSCVEHAKFQAFTGNEFWTGIWDDVGRTDEAMRDACQFLSTDQPGWLEEIHAQWVVLQGSAEPADTAEPTEPAETSTTVSP